MKKLIAGLAGIAPLAIAAPAFASGSEHSHGILASFAHWLSSPHHGGMIVLGALTLVVLGGAFFALRKKA